MSIKHRNGTQTLVSLNHGYKMTTGIECGINKAISFG